MYIISQDRDQGCEYLGQPILLEFRIHNNVMMGYNLKMSNLLLGTFESAQEALEERQRIEDSTLPYYIVTGFSAWDEWETIKEAHYEE